MPSTDHYRHSESEHFHHRPYRSLCEVVLAAQRCQIPVNWQLLITLALVCGLAPHSKADTLTARTINSESHSPWYAGLGFNAVQTEATKADFVTLGSGLNFQKHAVAWPHLLVGYQFERLNIEGGYRKLGVLRVSTPDDAVQATTHSNALYFGVKPRFGGSQALSFYGLANVNLVRTVTEIDRGGGTSTLKSGKNVFQVVPSFGLGVAMTPVDHWTVRAELEVFTSKAGDAQHSGRTRQSWAGVQLIRTF